MLWEEVLDRTEAHTGDFKEADFRPGSPVLGQVYPEGLSNPSVHMDHTEVIHTKGADSNLVRVRVRVRVLVRVRVKLSIESFQV